MANCLMSNSPYPSQAQDKFVLRLPDGMRDRIKAAAEAANRSMNAEIVATLEEKYPGLPALTVDEMFRFILTADSKAEKSLRIEELNRRLAAQESGLNAKITLTSDGHLALHIK